MRLISPEVLKDRLAAEGEIALLDVREEGRFAARHLLHAVPLPLSRLELRLAPLVPRRATPVVLVDEADGLAERAAARMAGFGYTDISVLEGGIEAWAAAGYELFSGVNVPSKAFGEFVEETYGTPRIPAAELKQLIDSGTRMVILDSRPMSEYRVMNIPGAIDCPGAELVYRLGEVAPDPETLVVVNCAGRTRSIIGAQSLINAGVPNRVVALENGTMGWHLAGEKLEHGRERPPPPVGPEAHRLARERAAAVAARFGVREIDADELARWRNEPRTVYLLDVRSPEEYRAGHKPGSRSAPGGQLVQATDRYVGVRNSRLVLIDDDGVRATMTASWLIQMGWAEVRVLAGGLPGTGLDEGDEPQPVLGFEAAKAAAPGIGPTVLAGELAEGRATVIDLADSLAYRDGHIPGARFAVRSRLEKVLPLKDDTQPVLTSPDGVLAILGAAEAAKAAGRPVRVLNGGTASWTASGRTLEDGPDPLSEEGEHPDDVWYRPYDRTSGIESAMRDYLSWEIGLVRQIEKEGGTRFRKFP